MTWFGWGLIIMWVLSPLLTVAAIGKPRKNYTNMDAIIAIITTCILIAGTFVIGINK